MALAGISFNVSRTSVPISRIRSPHCGHTRSSSGRRCSTTSTGMLSGTASFTLPDCFRVWAATWVVFCGPGGAVYASASLNRRLICPSSGSLVCSLDAPDCFFFNRRSCSISHRYCCAVSCRASPPFLGHWKLPLSSRLYTSTNPSPSQYSPLSRSFRRPQNRNCAFWNESR